MRPLVSIRTALICAAALALAGLVPAAASADPVCTINWDPAVAGGEWSNPNNWVEDRVPTETDDACIEDTTAGSVSVSAGVNPVGSINSQKPLTISGSAELKIQGGTEPTALAKLSMMSGALSGSGDVEIADEFYWYAGWMAGTGTTTVAETASMTLASPGQPLPAVMASTRTLVNRGTATSIGAGITASGDWTTPATFVNEGSLSIESGGGFDRGTGGTRLRNTGTITKIGGSTASFNWSLENEGEIDVQQGTLILDMIVTSAVQSGSFKTHPTDGHIRIWDGNSPFVTHFRIAGATELVGDIDVIGVTVTAESDISLVGSLYIQYGALDGPGNIDIDGDFTLLGGVVSGSGDLTISPGSSFNWTRGSFEGDGRTIISQGATARISPDTSGVDFPISGNRRFVNYGAMELAGAYMRIGGSSASRPSIVNHGRFELSGGSSIVRNSAYGRFTNTSTGSLVKTGPGRSKIDWPLDNDGAVRLEDGDLVLFQGDSDITQDGSFTATPGCTFYLGDSTGLLDGPFRLSGGNELSGNFYVDGAALILDGDVDVLGGFEMGRGSIEGTGDLSVTTHFRLLGGSVVSSGDITVGAGAQFFWSGGVLAGSGNATIAEAATGTIASSGWPYSVQMAGTRTIENYGTLYWNQGNINAGYEGSRIENYGRFEISGSGSTGLAYYPGSALPTLHNLGTIINTSAGSVSLGWPIDNDGEVIAAQGPIFLMNGSAELISDGDFISQNGNALTFDYGNGASNYVLRGGNQLSGYIRLAGGVMRVGGDIGVSGRLNVYGGFLVGPGSVDVHGELDLNYGAIANDGETMINTGGRFDWIGGSLGGSGALVVSHGAQLEIEAGGLEGKKLSGSRTITNQGVAHWNRGPNPQAFTWDFIAMNGGPSTRPTFINDGALTLDENVGITNGQFEGSFVNSGSMTQLGGENLFELAFENAGFLDIAGGTLYAKSMRMTRDSVTRLAVGETPANQKRLNVGYEARYAGTLEVSNPNNQTVVAGDAFDLAQHDSFQGAFDQVTGVGNLGSLDLDADYRPDTVRVAAVTHSGFAGFRAFSFGGGSAQDSGSGSEGGTPNSSSLLGAFANREPVTSVRISPSFSLDFTSEKDDVVPGQSNDFNAKLSNTGAKLDLTGSFDAHGVAWPSTVSSYLASLEYKSAATGDWLPLAGATQSAPQHTPEFVPPVSTGLSLTASSLPSSGVTYSTDVSSPIVGTVLDPNTDAKWDYEASVDLTPAQVAILTDPVISSDVRLVERVELKFDKPGCVDPQLSGENVVAKFGDLTHAQTGALEDAQLALTRPDGSTLLLDADNAPELARLDAGETFERAMPFTPAAIAARGAAESQVDYLTRLAGEDNKQLTATAMVTGDVRGRSTRSGDEPSDGIDPIEGAAGVTQHIPILGVEKDGPAAVGAGETAVYDISVSNTGSADAQTTLSDKVNDTPQELIGAPDDLPAGGTAAVTANVLVPTSGDSVTDVASVEWQDSEGNSYGPVADTFTSAINGGDVSQPVPSPVDETAPVETFVEETQFLYEGDNKIQLEVAEGAIEPARVGVVRGVVKDLNGALMPGVRVSVLDHPEYGYTLSRDDGSVYMAVNGGGPLTLNFEKAGFLRAQRSVEPDWNDYTWMSGDVALVKLDTEVADISLTEGTSETQVAQGSEVIDASGTRRSTLIFNPGTTAKTVESDGSEAPLPEAHVRASEITVGPNGPDAMPGELPPTSAYTYAVAFSADEAILRDSVHVEFSQPVINYVENFLKFPVGEVVPSGFQDPKKNVWVPAKSGRIVRVLSEANGEAVLDVNGDGVAATSAELSEYGITTEELARVSELYSAGESLWRVPIEHFSNHNIAGIRPEDAIPLSLIVGDHNWGWRLPLPNILPPGGNDPNCGCKHPGQNGQSIVYPETQVLGEDIPLEGVPTDLHYSSERMPGFKPSRSVTVPMTGEYVPDTVKRVDVLVSVAGRRDVESFEPEPNQNFTYEWDGKDVFGRSVAGARDIEIRVGFIYDGVYGSTPSFGEPVAQTPRQQIADKEPFYETADFMRRQAGLWRTHKSVVSQFSTEWTGLGGWSLGLHHFYDPATGTLHRGDGQSVEAAPVKLRRLEAVSGTSAAGSSGDGGPAANALLNSPHAVAFGPDGTAYVADTDNNRIRKIDPNGTITSFAGTGAYGFSGDGGPATNASFASPQGIAFVPGGTILVADTNNNRIRQVDANGTVRTIAGGGPASPSLGDGGPATSARLNQPVSVLASKWGDIFIADRNHNRIRRVAPGGTITTYAGTGAAGFSGDGGLASAAKLQAPTGLAIGPDDALLVADTKNNRVREIAPTGRVRTVAGGGLSLEEGDNRPATQARLISPRAVVATPDGEIYIAEGSADRVRRVGPDGYMSTAAHENSGVIKGESVNTQQGGLVSPTGLALSPSGAVYIADSGRNRIIRFVTIAGGYSATNILVNSPSGDETYEFTPRGRHLRTMSSTTGATLVSFEYDDAGNLTKFKDADGNETTIEHDDQGNPEAIVGPYGKRTELSVDSGGLLGSAVSPSGATSSATYGAGKLLHTFTNPRGRVATMTYDSKGRLKKDSSSAGNTVELTRDDRGETQEVESKSALGRATIFGTKAQGGIQERWVTDPAGNTSSSSSDSEGTSTQTDADGTKTTSTTSPDPRFGLESTFAGTSKTTLPSGREVTASQSREVTLDNPDNPFSLRTESSTSTVNDKTDHIDYERTSQAGAQYSVNQAHGKLMISSPAGREVEVRTDALGRPLSVDSPETAQSTLTYDSRGRVSSESTGTRTSSYAYNNQGQVESTTDPLGRVTTYSYDAAGRATSVTLPGARTVQMTYDANGNLTSVTPPSRPAHEFTYNLADLVSSATAPFAAGTQPTTTYAYDDDRNPTRITRPSGDAADIDYDNAGRVSTVATLTGTSSATYSPATGQIASASSEDGETSTYSFDGPLPTRIAQSGAVSGTIDLDYNADLNLSNLTAPGGATPYEYDNDGLLTKAGALAISRSQASGRVTGLTLDGTSTTRTYNNFQEPLTESTTLPGSTAYSEVFTRDAIGRIETKTETAPSGSQATFSYTYDPAGRLTEVTKNGNPYRAYAFDANGNRTTATRQTSSGPVTESATFDAQDKQTTSGAFDLTYNANGELTQKTNRESNAAQTYAYSTLGALKSVTMPSGAEISYKYDAQGNRVEAKTDGAATQRLIYAPGLLGPVAELATANRAETRYVYASRINVPDYMVRGGRTYRLVTDQLGSVRFVVDAVTGEIAQEITYDPFGEVLSDSAPGFQPFGFAGGLYSLKTGLTHFGAREYDASLGRWTSRDPISFGGGDTSLYNYVSADPINIVDPSGRYGIHDLSYDISHASDTLRALGAAAGDTRATLRDFATFWNRDCTCPSENRGSAALNGFLSTNSTIPGLVAPPGAAALYTQLASRLSGVPGVITWLGEGGSIMQFRPVLGQAIEATGMVATAWVAGTAIGSLIRANYGPCE